MSLFHKPSKKQAGLKVLVYGEEGTGKTVFALSFPDSIIIDTEAGSVFYEGTAEGENLVGVLRTQSYSEYEDALEEVKEDWEQLGVKTLITDSVTKIRQSLSDVVLNVDVKRNKRKGMADAELNSNLSIRSWGKIGEISKRHQNMKIDLSNNVNVVDVAQMKKITDENGNVKELRPDMDKSSPYDYDIKMRMATKETDDGVKFYGLIEKDRTKTFKVGDIVESPSYEMWKHLFDNGGERLQTGYTDQQKQDEVNYEEESAKDDMSFIEKVQDFISGLDEVDKKEFADLLTSKKLNKLKTLTKTQEKEVLNIMKDFNK